jgi:hypothetical protein
MEPVAAPPYAEGSEDKEKICSYNFGKTIYGIMYNTGN